MCTKIKGRLSLSGVVTSPYAASTHINHVEKQKKNKQVCPRPLTSLSRSSPVVFAWLRPECSSADQIHTEEDEGEEVEDLDVDWLL